MKILHTSDWHLGHQLYEYDRIDEHRSFLQQLTRVMAEEQPDAMVVCGDVFDRVAPSAEARQLYVKALLALRDQCPDVQIIVMAGNHDGKAALEVEGMLWDRLQVKVVGQVERLEDGSVNFDRHIVEVHDNTGHAAGFIIAVPHIYEHGYPQLGEAQTKEERQRAFFQRLLDETARRNPDGLPVVLTAHLSLTGSNFAGHIFAQSVGNIETVDQATLGRGYDYLALGHIHNAKTFTGEGPVARYCGTPLAISFDETGHHGVTIVTLNPGEQPGIREVDIRNPRPLLTIPDKPLPFEEALRELAGFPADKPAYIRLNVLYDAPLPYNYVEQILQTLQAKQARYCCVKTSLVKKKENAEEESLVVNADNMPDPLTLADFFYLKKFKVTLADQQREMLEEVVNQCREA